MNVLVACEESQRVCLAFRARGHNAFSCDLQSCSGGAPQYHIKGDCLPLLNGRCSFVTENGDKHTISDRWDLIIAHPPCIFMSKAGARWMFPDGTLDLDRYEKALAARSFFYSIWRADCDRICIENPTPLKIVCLPPPSQVVQPFQFGDAFSKRTCLWEKNLPPLVPTKVLDFYVPYCPSNTSNYSKGFGGSKGVASSARSRSCTFLGIANAMADQWG